MWNNYLFLDTPDQHLVSLDAATGKERWNQQKADYRGDNYATTAPTVINNHVLTPAGGDYLDVPGWLESRDPETGALQWKWNATPRAGEPGIETWPDAFAAERGGAAPWQPVTYDPDLNLIYLGTGNPQPVLIAPRARGPSQAARCSPRRSVATRSLSPMVSSSPISDPTATRAPVPTCVRTPIFAPAPIAAPEPMWAFRAMSASGPMTAFASTHTPRPTCAPAAIWTPGST